ncbi:N(6)-adenine-specific methyltransferase METTL4 [Aphidius gifuensis]|uniref:N(6)-adenine-specific methyltransferase METTL4 n=1 Tax=Aphidius gifuensis TaxID=684658 RepID=UPI001CDD3848|nr:N(6)-adenine-specific methyltransferase METTL4 [Aphidius gifuensis]
MSLLISTGNGALICHLNYINKIYNSVENNNNEKLKLQFNDKLFKLTSKYLRDNQVKNNIEDKCIKKCRKRKKADVSISPTDHKKIQFIHENFDKIITVDVKKNFFNCFNVNDNNIEARAASDNFYCNTFNEQTEFYGSNPTNFSVIKKINDVDYVFPNDCKFYCYDVRLISKKIDLINQYDFVLMDPPWWNKFIRRKKETKASYEMMYNDELVDIPIAKLLTKTGIVGIWCTNAKSHLNHIVDVMLPAWGMKVVATWYWVKVTQLGDPICDFNYKMGKQPYELLIFGARVENNDVKIPDQWLLVSVPSSVHSHKPPLTEIMEPYLPKNPNCLEIFARYLLPRWTSWGLEVLKFQNMMLYNSIKNKEDTSLLINHNAN